jgi:plasmid stabilization system protein ParE
MTFQVQFTRSAQEDLERLFDFIIERELASATGDLDIADRALEAIRVGIQVLQTSPFTCRKASNSPFLRELVNPFGSSGYVALFEIANAHEVIIAAVRHQREDDYY